jgi:hypothetical protein
MDIGETQRGNDGTARVTAWVPVMDTDIQMRFVEEGASAPAAMSRGVNGDKKDEAERERDKEHHTALKTVVTCDLKGYFATADRECSDPTPFEVSSGQRYSVGDGDAIPGIELALRRSSVGDVFDVFIVPKFAFGPLGRRAMEVEVEGTDKDGDGDGCPPQHVSSRAVPPHSHVLYRISVREHWCPEDEEEKGPGLNLRLALVRKECGNRFHRADNMPFACRCYAAGVKLAEEAMAMELDLPKDAELRTRLLKT